MLILRLCIGCSRNVAPVHMLDVCQVGNRAITTGTSIKRRPKRNFLLNVQLMCLHKGDACQVRAARTIPRWYSSAPIFALGPRVLIETRQVRKGSQLAKPRLLEKVDTSPENLVRLGFALNFLRQTNATKVSDRQARTFPWQRGNPKHNKIQTARKHTDDSSVLSWANTIRQAG